MELQRFSSSTNAERHAGLAGAWLLSLPSENTQRAYRGDLTAYFSFLDSGSLDALAAERRHVDLWRKTLAGAPTTVARRLAAVSSFYRYAAGEGLAPAQPVQNVKRPKIDASHSTTQALTKEEARRFLAAAEHDGPRSHALASLLLFTGIRISEALSATLGDLAHDASHRVLIVTRKGGKRQKIALPAPVMEALNAYLGRSTAEGSEVVTTATAPSGAPLFTTSTGKGWAQSEAFRTVGRLAREAGIEGRVSPHSLRHTHITEVLEAGAPLHQVQDSVGHSDPRTTQRYNHSRGRLEHSSAYVAARLFS